MYWVLIMTNTMLGTKEVGKEGDMVPVLKEHFRLLLGQYRSKQGEWIKFWGKNWVEMELELHGGGSRGKAPCKGVGKATLTLSSILWSAAHPCSWDSPVQQCWVSPWKCIPLLFCIFFLNTYALVRGSLEKWTKKYFFLPHLPVFPLHCCDHLIHISDA